MWAFVVLIRAMAIYGLGRALATLCPTPAGP